MEFKRFNKKYFLRLDKGEEIVQTLKDFCVGQGITFGSIQGIGASNKIELGLFETGPKEYRSRVLEGDHEIAPLVGNVTTMDGEGYLHCHITVSDKECRAFAGHLNSAIVSATFECVIDTEESSVDRVFSSEIGLNLLKFSSSITRI